MKLIMRGVIFFFFNFYCGNGHISLNTSVTVGGKEKKNLITLFMHAQFLHHACIGYCVCKSPQPYLNFFIVLRIR